MQASVQETTSGDVINSVSHIYLTDEEKMEGASLGDSYVVSENIIGLYRGGADENTVMGEWSEQHMLVDVRNYVPDKLKLPRVWEFVGSIYVKSRDEVADEVVLCMPLQEFDLEDGAFTVYTYEGESQGYVAQKMNYPGSNTGVEFPYIYHNVLYMQMQEYEKNYEGTRHVTVILRTKK